MMTRPESALRNPIMCFSVTDFPTPLRPIITEVSPRFTVKLTWSSTGRSSKAFETSRNSKKFCGLESKSSAAVRPLSSRGRLSFVGPPRLILSMSVIFLALRRSAALPRTPRGYSCSRRAAPFHQNVSTPFVNNFHSNAFHGVGHFAYSIFKRKLPLVCCPRVPARAERLKPPGRLRGDDGGPGRDRAILEVGKPLTREKRHVAAYDQAPGRFIIACVRIYQCTDDAAKRPLARPVILHKALAKFCVALKWRHDADRSGNLLNRLAHPREHGLAVQFRARFVETKSRACASGHNVSVYRDAAHCSNSTANSLC